MAMATTKREDSNYDDGSEDGSTTNCHTTNTSVVPTEQDDCLCHNSRRCQRQPPPPPIIIPRFETTSTSCTIKGLKIGVYWDHVNNEADDIFINEMKRIVHYLEVQKGCIVVNNIELPHLTELHQAHTITILTEMILYLEKYIKHGNNLSDFQLESQVSLLLGTCFTSTEFVAAQRIRAYAMKHIEQLFQENDDGIDILLSPATAIIAPPILKDTISVGEYNPIQTSKLMKYIIHGNMTGIPAITFPCGYYYNIDSSAPLDCSDDNGNVDDSYGTRTTTIKLPISLQAQAGHYKEDVLFRFVHEIMKDDDDDDGDNGENDGGGNNLRFFANGSGSGWQKPIQYVDVLGTILNKKRGDTSLLPK